MASSKKPTLTLKQLIEINDSIKALPGLLASLKGQEAQMERLEAVLDADPLNSVAESMWDSEYQSYMLTINRMLGILCKVPTIDPPTARTIIFGHRDEFERLVSRIAV